MAEARILKELEELHIDPPDFISAGPINDDDIYHWEAIIDGPDDSYYKNGVFLLDIKIPKEYPFKPPNCKFKTKIFHPNISPDSGYICINILKPQNWNPSLTISNILMSIMALLYSPKFDDALYGKARDLYQESEQKYKETIQQWIKEYSGKETIKI